MSKLADSVDSWLFEKVKEKITFDNFVHLEMCEDDCLKDFTFRGIIPDISEAESKYFRNEFEYEYELKEVISQEIALELNMRVVFNLRRNALAQVNHKFESKQLFINEIESLTKLVEENCGDKVDFIISSPEMISILETTNGFIPSGNYSNFVNGLGSFFIGIFHKKKVFQCALFPTYRMLIGNSDGCKVKISSIIRAERNFDHHKLIGKFTCDFKADGNKHYGELVVTGLGIS